MCNLKDFLESIDNYNLYHLHNLIKYGTKVCLSDDEDKVEKYFAKFNDEIADKCLHGSLDLMESITRAHREKKY